MTPRFAASLLLCASTFLSGCHLFGLAPSACDDDSNCPFDQTCSAGFCTADGRSDAGPTRDAGLLDAGADAGTFDAGIDAGSLDAGPAFDAGFDAGMIDAGFPDAGFDAGFPLDAGLVDAGPFDAGFDAGVDAGLNFDAGLDAGLLDAGSDGGFDAGLFDAGFPDAGFDAGFFDAGFDAGPFDAGFDAGRPLIGPQDFLAFWPLDGDATDVTGDHNGSSFSGVQFGPGVDGEAAYFTNGSYIDTGLFPELFSGNEGTISAWFRDDIVTDFKVLAGIGFTNFPDMAIGTFGSKMYYDVSNTSDDYIFFDDYGADIAPGRWHHVAATYDGTLPLLTRGSIFVDGVKRSIDPAEPLPEDHGNLSGLPFYISHPGDTRWLGAIDDVRFFNRALEPHEIGTLAAAFSFPIPQDFLVYIPFDGRPHDVARVDGTPLEPIPDLAYTVGQQASAARFTSTQEVRFEAQSHFDRVSQFSVAFWFRIESAAAIDREFFSLFPASNHNIVVKTTNQNELYFEVTNTGSPRAVVVDDFIAPSRVTVGNWHHLTVIYDARQSPGMRGQILLDGVSLDVDGSLPITTGDVVDTSIAIGNPTQDLDSTLDEFYVYSRALTPEEVDLIRQTPLP